MTNSKNILDQLVIRLKALSDPSRLRLFMAVQTQAVCVQDLTQLVELAPSTVSKHLSILKAAGLVTSYREGHWIYYQASGLLKGLVGVLEADAQIIADRKKLFK